LVIAAKVIGTITDCHCADIWRHICHEQLAQPAEVVPMIAILVIYSGEMTVQAKTISQARGSLVLTGVAAMLFSAGALAGGHTGAGGGAPSADGYSGPAPESVYFRHGFEGRLDELTATIMAAIEEAGPNPGDEIDFSPEQQALLGRGVARVIKTLRNDGAYQHEGNDALVKATLTTIQYGKDTGQLEERIAYDVRTQTPMLARVSRLIQEGANPELGLIAMTERTACFYHLVEEYARTGMTIRWKSPYTTVLASTVALGQHDMTEQWIHENYTIPLMTQQAAIVGMELEFSPWQEDGWIEMTARMPEQIAKAN